MAPNRKIYPADHWLRSEDTERALAAYLDQQSKAYSRMKNAFVSELLGDLRGKRFLDYGCGAGLFTVYAAKQGASVVVGVDAEETAIETARYHARTEKVEPICRFVQSEDFPEFLRGDRFDVILMKDVIEHVVDDDGLLQRAVNSIAPGGRLVLSTQNSLSLNFLVQGTYNRILLGNKDWFGWDETHLRFYTFMSLGRKLRRAGFAVKDWRSVYIIPYKLPALPGSKKKFLRLDALSGIDRVLGGTFPYNRLGWNIIVKAEASPLVPQRMQLPENIARALPAVPALV
ncbi:MAG: methyltransferase domain-containing protein [Desulfomonile tiedjei]|uniref:Methyltransferase domain-containing protein n=1 Tax=Desulfomonile tiedjei TaxID=2358 RepID=A0A9D6Z2D6_9BACT|nr:methyltransferase domain-containing protein [Desulfomonile tiedjei]